MFSQEPSPVSPVTVHTCSRVITFQTALTDRLDEIKDETASSADLPDVEGIRMLVEQAENYVQIIHKSVGNMVQDKKLTEQGKANLIFENTKLLLRAEKLEEIARPHFEKWK